MVLDQVYDYFEETPKKQEQNKKFIEFLKYFSKNAINLQRLPKMNSLEFNNNYLTISLSNPKLTLTQSNNNQQNFIIFNDKSIYNSNIKFYNHKVVVHNKKISKSIEKVKHKVLGKEEEWNHSEEMAEGEIKRLCPNIKEIHAIQQRILSRNKGCSFYEDGVYGRMVVDVVNI